MEDGFDIKKGLIDVLKKLLSDDGFVQLVLDLLLGKTGAAETIRQMMKRVSYEGTLNETVSVHRALKIEVSEGIEKDGEKDKGILRKLFELKMKSNRMVRRIVFRALKNPRVLVAFIKLIASDGTDAKSWAVVAPAIIDSAAEEMDKNKETQPALAEEATAKKLRRLFRHASNSKSVISESIEDKYGGRMPVNVYTGRFQPFHLGHLSNLEEAAKYGLRTVICPVMKGTSKNAKEHPFDAVEGEMLEKIKEAYGDLVADVVPIKNPFIEFWVLPLRERGFEPIMWTTGTDRLPSYRAMVEKYRDKYELSDNFEVVGIDKDMDAEGGSALDTGGISGTAIRKRLVDGDEEGFRRQMPKCLWDMYEEMRNILIGSNEPAVQSIAGLMESKEFKDFSKTLDEGLKTLL